MAEQAVLDLVPFAGSGRKKADLNFQSGRVAQALQFDFPEAVAAAVAPPAVSRNQQSGGLRTMAASQPRCRTHRRNPATFQRSCFHGCPAASGALRQLAGQDLMFVLNPLNNPRIHRAHRIPVNASFKHLFTRGALLAASQRAQYCAPVTNW
jgi:hypothetical protein